MKKLVNGQYSLPFTFWAIFICTVVVPNKALGISANQGAFDSMALLLSIAIAMSVWGVFVLIGLWKSATNYKGAPVWKYVVKFLVVTNGLSMIAGLMVGLGLI